MDQELESSLESQQNKQYITRNKTKHNKQINTYIV